MNSEVIGGILIPFVGTTLGAAGVFFMKKELSDLVQRALTGFAAGVMVAASVWSLLIPAMNQSEGMGRLAFIPAVVGFWIGNLFYWLWIISFLICTVTVKRRKDRRAGWRGRRCWCWR